MKKSEKKQSFLFGALLVLLSVFCYAVHFVIFRDVHHILIYLIGDIAFVFIEVLLVTLIIHQILSYREKRAIHQKLNMVIGAFFTKIGKLPSFCPNSIEHQLPFLLLAKNPKQTQ